MTMERINACTAKPIDPIAERLYDRIFKIKLGSLTDKVGRLRHVNRAQREMIHRLDSLLRATVWNLRVCERDRAHWANCYLQECERNSAAKPSPPQNPIGHDWI